MAKKNVIVDYKNVTTDILESIYEAYPYGYDDDDLIRYTNAKGEKVSALEVKTEEVNYLIKVGTEMDRRIASFVSDLDDNDDDLTDDDNDTLEVPEGDIE